MKKLLMFSVALLAFSGIASAAPCTLGTILTSSAGVNCDIGELNFSGFSALPAGTGLEFLQGGGVCTTPVSSATNCQGLVELVDNSGTGAGVQNFAAFTYTVSIDATQVAPLWAATLTGATSGMLVGNLGTSAAALTKIVTPGGTSSATDVNGTVTPVAIALSGTSVSVSDSFVVTSGTIADVSNTFQATAALIPTGTPEPVSMLLFGSGLLGLSLVGRKKLVRK
jgi:hypothetical protein